jgi:D-glycero-D-manno-heptose 1,7-bisphosphate phosphatase
MSKPCVFFDRDGIINVSPGPGYVERLEDFHLIPAFTDAMRLAKQRGYEVAVVTNQRGVSLGCMTMETVDGLHAYLRDAMAKEGLTFLDIMVCVVNDNNDPRRKPNPGMLLDIAQKHDVDMARSWMIGDNESDILAGHRAGCRTILVRPGDSATLADYRVPDMPALVALLDNVL